MSSTTSTHTVPSAALRCYHVGCTETPPSTTRSCPVIHSAIAEARNTQALPTSVGRPSRPSGAARRNRAMPSGQSRSRPSRQIRPGETLFTRMPYCPYCNAAVWAKWITAAFDAQ
jgi:hypothetical protein